MEGEEGEAPFVNNFRMENEQGEGRRNMASTTTGVNGVWTSVAGTELNLEVMVQGLLK